MAAERRDFQHDANEHLVNLSVADEGHGTPSRLRRRCPAVCGVLVAGGIAALGIELGIEAYSDKYVPSPPPPAPAYRCDSSLDLGPITSVSQKGIAVDDTTFKGCTSKIPQLWPNSQERLTSLRLFKAWDKNWGEQFRNESWKQLVDVVHRNGMKVLMGTQVSCDEDDDDSDWRLVLQLLKMLGRDHVMGVAVGNEMELLQFKQFITKECLDRIWKAGYFYKKLIARASDLDKIGFSDVPLTTVFGGYALAGEPFVESPTAMCYSFLTDAYKRFGRRWVFTLNIYPYFDPGNALDPGSTDKCSQSLKRDWCLDKTCNLPATTVVMRQKMEKLTGNSDDTLWLGETGWSYPQAASLSGANPQMAACAEFSSETAFRNYYSNFLHWDLSIGAGVKGPDHVFYFTLRDALNFGVGEHFGLIPDCDSQQCKLQENLTELGSSGAADASYEEMTRHSPEGEVTLV